MGDQMKALEGTQSICSRFNRWLPRE